MTEWYVGRAIRFLFVIFACFIGGCQSMGGMTESTAFPDEKVQALINAALNKDLRQAEFLVRQGADPNYVGTNGIVPLVWVIRWSGKDLRKVEVLLEAGADPNDKWGDDGSVMLMVAGGDNPDLLALLLRYGGDPDIVGPILGRAEGPALAAAAYHSRMDNIKLLLKSGADINGHEGGYSAAQMAALRDDFDIVRYLLDQGYSYDLTDLAKLVEGSVIDPKSPKCELKKQTVNMLRDRGVKFPAMAYVRGHVPTWHDPCLPDWHSQQWPVIN